jgi:2-phosphoglycolate phosphatase
MQVSKEVDAIIFDLDGTLIDSRRDIVNAVNFTLRSLGLRERPFNEIVSYVGHGIRDMLRKCLNPDNENSLDKAVDIFEEFFLEHALDETVLYLHVRDILEHFKEKTLLIITNRSKKSSELALQNLGILKYFKEIIGGDDEACLKPSPCPLEKAIARFTIKKERSIIVGDMDIDVLAGREAGIPTCAVTYGIGKKEDIVKAKPDYIINDLLDLKRIIR